MRINISRRLKQFAIAAAFGFIAVQPAMAVLEGTMRNQMEYLDGDKTILDTMIDAANEKNRSKVRDILGSFLFSGDEVDKYVKVFIKYFWHKKSPVFKTGAIHHL